MVARIGSDVRHWRQVEPNPELMQPKSRLTLDSADVVRTSGSGDQLGRRREGCHHAVHLSALLVEHDQDRMVQTRRRGQRLHAVAQRLHAFGAAEVGCEQQHTSDTTVVQQRAQRR
ncbi:MAG TPA: hypothetical protein VHJ99_01100 [Candidatus Dormibacteraeota bacterium]|nr:hypothetical protein [Candidatus Dormibacteraeota bacterium]